MVDWITGFIEQFGYIGIFLLMLLENVFPPIPSEIILPLSGLSVAEGRLHPFMVLLSASLGALAGGYLWYLVGKWFGEERLDRFMDNHGRWLGIAPREYYRTLRFFKKHSGKAVFLGRMLPAFRTLISIPAGMVHMSLPRFLFYSSLGTVIWSGLLIYAGYALQEQYKQISDYVNMASNIIIGVIIVLYFYKLIQSRIERRREKKELSRVHER